MSRWTVFVKAVAVVIGIAVVLAGLSVGLYVWKEYLPHYEAGALGTVRALQGMQRSYLQQHGEYATNFRDLGGLLGAEMITAREMKYRGYVYRFLEARTDAQGRVSSYVILAQPQTYKHGSKRSFLLTDTSLHYTDSPRGATVTDAVLQRPGDND